MRSRRIEVANKATQHTAVLLPDAFHVPLRPHRPPLRHRVSLPRPLRPLQPHRQLPLQHAVLRRSLLPNPHRSPNDVRRSIHPSTPTPAPPSCRTKRLANQPPVSAAYVKGRNNFNSNGQHATLGKYAFGFMWAAVACFFLAMVLFCVAGVASKKSSAAATSSGAKKRGRYFGRKNTARSRGSFIDSESQRRPIVVKDEYS